MGRILITGNGFDLYHGLPTKYGHMMCILNEIHNNDATDIKQLLGKLKTNFPGDYKRLNDNYEIEKLKIDGNDIEYLHKELEENNLFNYFKQYSINKIENWIDFEVELKNLLDVLISVFNDVYNFQKEQRFRNIITPHHNNNSVFSIVNLEKLETLKNSKFIHGRSSYYFLDKYYMNKIDKLETELIIKDLLLSLNNFIKILHTYFILFVNPLYKSYKQKNITNTLFSSIDKVYTFNYTPTYEKFYNENIKVEYLHGKMNEDIEQQNMVLGVDEITDEMKEIGMIPFTKYYQKLYKETDYKFLFDYQSPWGEEVFYIFGHSLDRSDSTYINELFDIVGKYQKCKICVFHHSLSSKGNLLSNLLKIIGQERIEKYLKNEQLYFLEMEEEIIKKEMVRNLYQYKLDIISSDI